jgi:hypothetical protein
MSGIRKFLVLLFLQKNDLIVVLYLKTGQALNLVIKEEDDTTGDAIKNKSRQIKAKQFGVRSEQ